MRRAPVLAAAVLSAAVAVVPSTAFAAPYPCTVTRTFSAPLPNPSLPTAGTYVFHPNEDFAGAVYWNQNPINGQDFDQDGVDDPGDALIAFDGASDGCGIEARISSIDRTATTRGQNAPYLSPWASGNLPELHHYDVRIFIVKGSWRHEVPGIVVTS